MKKVLTLLFLLLLGSMQLSAQVSKNLEVFRANLVTSYGMYFTHAEFSENGHLSLTAVDKYMVLPTDSKRNIMRNVFTSWPDSITMVKSGSKCELWGWRTETGSITLLDAYDLNASPLLKTETIVVRPHPWFFYIGGQLGGSTQHDINLSINTRLGFFLLLNRWDLAATFSFGASGYTNIKSSSSAFVNAGLMSRVHFPIKKTGLSPYVGGQISVSYFGGEPTLNGGGIIGMQWFVGIGSIDIGVNIGNIFSGSAGYTMVPRFRNKK
jgi:hypothetical protein